MSKYPVLADFIDKNSKILFKKGQLYETTSQNRVEELRKAGFIGGTTEKTTADAGTKRKRKKDESK